MKIVARWLTVAMPFTLVACGGSPSDSNRPENKDAGGGGIAVATDDGGGLVAPSGKPSSAGGPATLLLSLDDTIDGDDGDVKATIITSADLLDGSGAKLAGANITAGQAAFDLAGIAAGDYFIQVNGDADNLVPTRIDGPASTIEQTVGQKLRASLIGPNGSPIYRINTYSAGQGYGPVVKFSDGSPLDGRQAYVIVTLASGKIELKVLGTASPLSTQTTSLAHPSNGVRFDAWLINTDGQPHHGDAFNADGGAATCQMCHMNMTMKPASFGSITFKDGFCYHCHYGSDGPDNGFVDPAQ